MPALHGGHEAWARARAELEGLPHGALNIAHEAVDRHAAGAARDRVAVRFLPRRGPPQELSYAQLRRQTDRFACVLRDLGVARGEGVATLLGPGPEVHVVAHGTFKQGAVFAALSADLEAGAVADQLDLAQVRVLVTTPALHARAVAPARGRLVDLRHVLLVGSPDEVAAVPGALDLRAALAGARGGHHAARTDPTELALAHLEGAPPGPPVGTLHAHEAVVAHHATAGSALDLRAGDVLWCAADPASVPGLAYGVIGALTRGATCLVADEPAPGEAARLLAAERVDVWLTGPAPLAALGPGPAPPLPALRRVVVPGAPAPPGLVEGLARSLGRPTSFPAPLVLEAFCQPETGAIVLCGDPAGAVRPLPGFEAEVVTASAPVEPVAPGRAGELALRAGWPSMVCGDLRDEGRLHRRFAAGWYLTGQPARREEDGRLVLLAPAAPGGRP